MQRVKLLKFVDGQWKVVDYGYAKYADLYTRQGYVVQFM